MSLFLIKSILAIGFLLCGSIAVLSMFILMGKANLKTSATILRRIHRATGFVFIILMLVISYFCIRYLVMVGDNLSTRAVLHGVLALGLLAVLILKILIVQFYKQLIRFAPAMGMIVFCMAFAVTSTSAGYYFLRMLYAKPEPAEISPPSQTPLQGNTERGASLFESKCSSCHFADREDKKKGPGLKSLLKKKKLPKSRRPATVENVKKQLIRPFLIMPSFASLSEQNLADLLAYLETL